MDILLHTLYMVGTSNQSVPEMAIDIGNTQRANWSTGPTNWQRHRKTILNPTHRIHGAAIYANI